MCIEASEESERPWVTIGLPVFNGANFIACAIDSLLKQTFNNFELIVSDNGSTDETQEICCRYQASDTRVRYIRQKVNQGAIANFNLLVQEARGRYFKWAAHDDICEPTYLQHCVELLDTNPDIVWCHSDSDMVDFHGVSWLHRVPKNDEEIELDARGKRRWAGLPRKSHDHSRPSKRFAGVLLGTRWCVDSYGVIRTSVLRKTGLYPNIYGSEKVLIGELSLAGPTHQIPRLLFKQRIHTAASGYQDNATAEQEFVAARSAKPFTSTRLQLLLAHLQVVRMANVSHWEKLCCYLVLLRYVFQCRKWFRLMIRYAKRKGVGGGARRIIDASNERSNIKTQGLQK